MDEQNIPNPGPPSGRGDYVPPESPYHAAANPGTAMPYGDMLPEGFEGNKDARMWAMFCHLSSLAILIGVPFGNVIGPLVCWLIKKDEFPFVDDHGKESLNFQITLTIAGAVIGVVGVVTACIAIGYFILLIGGLGLLIYGLVMAIIAAMKANAGEYYRYPMNIRMVK